MNRIQLRQKGSKLVAALGGLLHTQADQYELSGVSAHNPQQAEHTDAMEGGVASTLDG